LAGAVDTGFGEPTPFGHVNVPFWLRTTRIFSLSDMLPKSALTALQHATQLSSLLLPVREEGTRCSTLASSFGSDILQKKHRPPWANMSLSSGLVVIRLSITKDTPRAAACRLGRAVQNKIYHPDPVGSVRPCGSRGAENRPYAESCPSLLGGLSSP
jgi:hypothetical protein